MHSPSFRSSRRHFLKTTLLLASGFTLAGCGFRLRGPRPLNFSSIYIGGVSRHSELGIALRLQIASNHTLVEEDPDKAEVKLQLISDDQDREILSLTGTGKVREYQLTRRVRFRLIHRDGTDLILPTEISAQREYTFNDSQILGKEQEENLLLQDMKHDLVQQIMRRLAAVNINKKSEPAS